MAKRSTTLSPKKKSRRSRKTKKRLAIKKETLAKIAAKTGPNGLRRSVGRGKKK